MTSIPPFNFIPMIIFGNPALAVLVSDKQFEGLRKCLSLIFNNYDLSHSEQFDTDLFSVLVSTSVTATGKAK
jgi:hypothetical protein